MHTCLGWTDIVEAPLVQAEQVSYSRERLMPSSEESSVTLGVSYFRPREEINDRLRLRGLACHEGTSTFTLKTSHIRSI
jgi:hypothetical protein